MLLNIVFCDNTVNLCNYYSWEENYGQKSEQTNLEDFATEPGRGWLDKARLTPAGFFRSGTNGFSAFKTRPALFKIALK